MPSIPQSLLWISLVVLWLFVLVPMLVSRRDAVRRTSDVALATRVLTRDAAARLLKRAGPAAGHRSDPGWQPPEDELTEQYDRDLSTESGSAPPQTRSMVAMPTVSAEADHTGPEYLDVEIVDEDSVDSGALPVGDGAAEPAEDKPAEVDDERAAEPEFEMENGEIQDGGDVGDVGDLSAGEYEAGEYEYVDDTAGLEVEEDPPIAVLHGSSRRSRYDLKTAAAVSARKYKFRKRVLMAMGLILVASAAVAYTVAPAAWWICGVACGVTVLYLAYLRRQTRIEARLRRRRTQRMARARLGVENADDREFDVVPSRLRRPGAAVLDIDDEDPIFEHLDYAPYASGYGLPRASGQ